MSHSFHCFFSAVTRQNAGNSLRAAAVGPIGGPTGDSNAPAATVAAEGMVVSGSLRLLRLSHDAARAGWEAIRMIATAKARKKRARKTRRRLSLLIPRVT